MSEASVEIVMERLVEGHTDRIFSMAFIPERNIVVTLSRDFSIRIWCMSTYKCETFRDRILHNFILGWDNDHFVTIGPRRVLNKFKIKERGNKGKIEFSKKKEQLRENLGWKVDLRYKGKMTMSKIHEEMNIFIEKIDTMSLGYAWYGETTNDVFLQKVVIHKLSDDLMLLLADGYAFFIVSFSKFEIVKKFKPITEGNKLSYDNLLVDFIVSKKHKFHCYLSTKRSTTGFDYIVLFLNLRGENIDDHDDHETSFSTTTTTTMYLPPKIENVTDRIEGLGMIFSLATTLDEKKSFKQEESRELVIVGYENGHILIYDLAYHKTTGGELIRRISTDNEYQKSRGCTSLMTIGKRKGYLCSGGNSCFELHDIYSVDSIEDNGKKVNKLLEQEEEEQKQKPNRYFFKSQAWNNYNVLCEMEVISWKVRSVKIAAISWDWKIAIIEIRNLDIMMSSEEEEISKSDLNERVGYMIRYICCENDRLLPFKILLSNVRIEEISKVLLCL